MNADRPSPSSESPSPTQSAKSPQRLFQGAREVLIEPHGEVYRLLETRNGKLILQK